MQTKQFKILLTLGFVLGWFQQLINSHVLLDCQRDWSYHHKLYSAHWVLISDYKNWYLRSCSIFFCYKYTAKKEDVKKEFKYKHKFSNQSIGTFKLRLCYINWSKVRQYRKANEADSNYFNIIDSLYDECFAEAKIRLKEKKNFTPWITRGIKKSS